MAATGTRIAAAALCAAAVAALASRDPGAGVARAKDSKAELQKDLRDEDLVGDWIYDDIDAGFARAAREKKPLCVVFR